MNARGIKAASQYRLGKTGICCKPQAPRMNIGASKVIYRIALKIALVRQQFAVFELVLTLHLGRQFQIVGHHHKARALAFI